MTKVEEWTHDIVKALSEAFDLEIKYDDEGFIKLPVKYEFIDKIRGIGNLVQDYKTVNLIGEYLFGIGMKYAQADKEELLKNMSLGENDKLKVI